ncbi:MAG: hypothetical protein M3Q88_00400 [Pseudomonadota bacterium]|nr:hypothetical protein [Pseudomonadota bacterium]
MLMRGGLLPGAVLCLAAAGPSALAPADGGLWQVARSARGAPEQSLCVADPILIGQWEHRGGHCSREILTDQGDKTVITYSCADGGFGRSEITLLTPRTLRVATQGIAAGAPFNYVLHARRVGNCTNR